MANGWDERFAARVRANYFQRLPEKIEGMCETATHLDDHADRRNALLTLQHRLRELATSTALLDLQELSTRVSTLKWTVDHWVRNDAEIGTAKRIRFTDSLEALEDAATDEGVATEVGAEVPADGPERPRVAARIGLVEHDEALAEALSDGLRAEADVEVARLQSLAALEEETERPLDALVTGSSALARDPVPKSVAEGLRCPLLLLTAEDDVFQRLQAGRNPLLGHLSRPVRVERLLGRLQTFVAREQDHPFRILLLAGDEAGRLADLLGAEGLIAEPCEGPRALMSRLRLFQPDVILMQASEELDPVEVARVVRFSEIAAPPGILVRMGEDETPPGVWSVERGPDVALPPSCDPRQLVVAVKVLAERVRQLTELLTHDRLTGVLNQARISEELDVEISKADRAGVPLSLALLDIDGLSSINTDYGHVLGDDVVRSLAELLGERLRRSDRIGRYGGDKFLVVLPNCSHEAAEGLLEHLRTLFRERTAARPDRSLDCSVSIGAACSTEVGWDDLLFAADRALRHAKSDGRDCVRIGG